MGKRLALAIALMLGSLAVVQAQQASGSSPYSGLGTGTPGGGAFGKSKATPGAEEKQTVPGGGIPMGAASQDSSEQPKDPSNFGSTGSSKSR